MKIFLLFLVYFWGIQFTLAQLTINVYPIPNNTPDNDNIYIAGNFNSWNPGNSNYILSKDSTTAIHKIVLNIPVGNIQFKFTRGSWASVEGNAQGGAIGNRTFSYNGSPTVLNLTILSWEDLVGNNQSTASPQVSLLSSNFFMPQLNRNRRIWIYLPQDYQSSQKHYPVIYMQDGQNLFDNKTSFAGEWKVDETLDNLYHEGDYGCIIIGIENGGGQRINEYSPWVNPQYGGGQGHEYMRFIVETLKPYVDNNFRTKKEPKYTGIVGSSMGGLISMYGGIEFQNTFGKIGALSSSYWFSQEVYNHVSTTGTPDMRHYYLIAGHLEGGAQVDDMLKMETTLKSTGLNNENIFIEAHSDGRHNEAYWSREFPKMYKWFWKDDNLSQIKEIKKNKKIDFSFIQNNDHLTIDTSEDDFDGSNLFYNFSNISGQNIITNKLELGKPINISELNTGYYFVNITNQYNVIFNKKIFVRNY